LGSIPRGVAILLLAALASCSRGGNEPRRLPAAPEPFRSVDNTLLIELPDSGGFLANGVPVDTSELVGHFRVLFGSRAAGHRAVFVRAGEHRSWADVDAIARRAVAAGGRAFDADLSGWPPPVPGLPEGQ
jgi:hypothetical protein